MQARDPQAMSVPPATPMVAAAGHLALAAAARTMPAATVDAVTAATARRSGGWPAGRRMRRRAPVTA